MADKESRKRAKDSAENSADEQEEDDMIGPMPAPPLKAKKRRGSLYFYFSTGSSRFLISVFDGTNENVGVFIVMAVIYV